MKRIGVRILVFLLIGAVVNVAVAWACALWSPTVTTWDFYFIVREPHFTRPPPQEVLDIVPPDWMSAEGRTGVWIDRHGADGFGYGERLLQVQAYDPETGNRGSGQTVFVARAGWPLGTMQRRVALDKPFFDSMDTLLPARPSVDTYHSVFSDRPPVRAGRPVGRDGVAAPLWLRPRPNGISYLSNRDRNLPASPLAAGFVLNTLLYGAVAWAVLCGPSVARGLIRGRRGLCAACAYPIGASAVCSECGGAVVPRAGVPA